MADPFIGQITIVGFNFAPTGWAACDGQVLPISQNTALFSLLGTMYGGNGVNTFALPNFQGRAPVHRGTTVQIGETAGEEAHTLTSGEMPTHNHPFLGTADAATSTTPAGNVLAAKAAIKGTSVYAPAPATQPLAPSVGSAGNGQPHQNLQPMLSLFFVIAIAGIFPSRN